MANSQAGIRPNGAGAAALLAAGVGCLALALLAFAGDKSPSFKSLLVFYRPTGALSGVSILATILWVIMWAVLASRWADKTVDTRKVSTAAFLALLLSLLLTFPPIVDFL